MAVWIQVLSGPDEGMTFDLSKHTEARIGRGAGNHFSPTDPAWSGSLTVEFRKGIYYVRNNLKTSVYLGGDILGIGQEAVWYSNVELEATPDTRLKFVSDSRGPKAAGDDPEEAKQKARNRLSIGIILLAVPVVAFAFLAPTDEALQNQWTSGKALQEYNETNGLLLKAMRETKDDDLQRIQAEFSKGRFQDVSGHLPEAKQHYLATRDLIDRKIGDEHAPRGKLNANLVELLERVRQYINNQLVVINPLLKKRR